MKTLFDNGTPKPIARTGHEVAYTRRIGWHELENGELIQEAEEPLSGRGIALVVLGNSPWPLARHYLKRIAAAVNAATPGSYTGVEIPCE